MKFELKFEKLEETDVLELPVLYVSSDSEGLSGIQAWGKYREAYDFTKKKIESLIENLKKLNNQLDEDFSGFEWVGEDENEGNEG